MTLTGRFSTLFLTALAIALLAFSASLYVVAKIHLERQIAERIAAALDVLAAAAEIHPDCVEWEPDERFLLLGQEDGLDQLRWVIRDPEGNVVDDSINLADADLPDRWPREPDDGSDQVRLVDGRGRLWLAAHRRVMPGRPDSSGSKVEGTFTALHWPAVRAGTSNNRAASISGQEAGLRTSPSRSPSTQVPPWLPAHERTPSSRHAR